MKKSAAKLKIACIGAGSSGVGQMILFEQYEPGCCVAFCDRNRKSFDENVNGHPYGIDMSSLRADFRDLPFYTDVDEMLAKEDINTVIIATYCCSHAAMIAKCVQHRLNIVLEKPIAITRHDVEKVWKLLRHYPKVATVNFTMRAAPVSLAAKRHVRNGDIGKITSVQYVNNVHYGDGYFRNWMRTRANIGSLLLQKATHDLDIINSIIGLTPTSIAAFGSRQTYGGNMPNDLTCDACTKKATCAMSIYRRQLDGAKPLPPLDQRRCVYAREIDIDDNHVLIIQYAGGVTASYSQTFNAPSQGGQRGGWFIGTEGIMQLEYYGDFVETPQGETIFGASHLTIRRRNAKPGTRIHEVYDWAGHNHFDGTEYGKLAQLQLLHGHSAEAAGTIREGYISARMCLAAQESIETGKVVALNFRNQSVTLERKEKT